MSLDLTEIRVLSLWQPYATLMAIEAKKVETRSWKTPFRGLVAIHSAKRWTPEMRRQTELEPFRSALWPEQQKINPLPLGCVLAVGELYHIHHSEWFTHFEGDERAFGDYSRGRFGWLFKNMIRLKVPIAYRASQGMPRARTELIEKLREVGF